MKKVLAVLLALTMVLATLAGCAGSNTGSATPTGPAAANQPDNSGSKASSKDTLVIRVNSDPTSFDPYTSGYGNSMIIVKSVFETLVNKDNEGNIKPGLATEWKWSEDGMSITFKLREGVLFHNGEKFSADDVIWSLNTFRTKLNIKETIFDFINMEKISDYEVKIPLLQPAGDALARLCDITYAISNQKAIEEAGDLYVWKPVGTGPYQFASWVQGDEGKLKAFDKYWDGKPKIDNLVMRIIPEDSQAMIELELGNIDVIIGPSLTDVDRVKKGNVEGVALGSYMDGNVWNLLFNYEKEWTFNKKLRQAISYAINKEDIVNGAYNGYAVVANQPMSSLFKGAYIEEYDPSVYSTYDPEKAKQLLSEAGYKPGELNLVMVTDLDDTIIDMAQLIKKNLSEVGINLEIRSYDSATAVGEFIGGNEDDVHMNITLTGNGYPIVYLKFSDPAYSPNWDHAADSGLFDEVYEYYKKALASTDRDECYNYVKQGVKIEVEETLMVPIVETESFYLYASGLKSLGYINGRDFNFKDAYFE